MAAKRILFKETNGDWENPGRVVLNWSKDPIRDLEMMAEKYQEMAHDRVELLKAQRGGIRGSDSFEAYPIVFLYRQAFELTLKAIIFTGKMAIEDFGWEPMATEKIMRHPLSPLFEEVTRIFFSISGDNAADAWDFKEPGLRTEDDFKAIVAEFDLVDRGSYTFRYSVKTDGKTPSLERGFEFDLFAFAEKMDRIIPALAGAPEWIRENLEWRAEMRYEARAAAAENADGDDYEYSGD
jgi:hypothetical protein